MSRIWEWLSLGGPVLLILIVLSAIVSCISIIKLWEFFEARLNDVQAIDQILEKFSAQSPEAALTLANQHPSPAAKSIGFALRAIIQKGSAPQELVLQQAAEYLLQKRSGLGVLEVIAGLSPLLGLLGTVIGMILAFQQIETQSGQVDIALLSVGIWQALLTTAAGLIVAIPASVMHQWFEQKLLREQLLAESALARVLNPTDINLPRLSA